MSDLSEAILNLEHSSTFVPKESTPSVVSRDWYEQGWQDALIAAAALATADTDVPREPHPVPFVPVEGRPTDRMPEDEARLLRSYHENRCGDPLCEALRANGAIDVLSGTELHGKPHNATAILLAAAIEGQIGPIDAPQQPVGIDALPDAQAIVKRSIGQAKSMALPDRRLIVVLEDARRQIDYALDILAGLER